MSIRVEFEDRVEWHDELGRIHREDGPAIEFFNGDRYWLFEGLRRRVSGPAVELSGGARFWYKRGKLHRIGGPSDIWPDGGTYWRVANSCRRI